MLGNYLLKQVSPKTRVRVGSILFDVSLVGWPASIILTNEPPFILSLSWLALTLTAWDIILTADIQNEE